MADTWNTIDAFVTGELVRAQRFQQIWENLYALKDPAYAEKYLPGPNTGVWTTTVATWAVISSADFGFSFESFGNPVLVAAQADTSHSAAGGLGALSFQIDGVRLGNDYGIFVHSDSGNQRETEQFAAIVDLAAGEHVMQAMFRTITGGTFEVWKTPCLRMFIWEF